MTVNKMRRFKRNAYSIGRQKNFGHTNYTDFSQHVYMMSAYQAKAERRESIENNLSFSGSQHTTTNRVDNDLGDRKAITSRSRLVTLRKDEKRRPGALWK